MTRAIKILTLDGHKSQGSTTAASGRVMRKSFAEKALSKSELFESIGGEHRANRHGAGLSRQLSQQVLIS